jgi:hypothetical protein
MVRVAQNPYPYFTVSSETLPTCRARFPYLYPPGTGWVDNIRMDLVEVGWGDVDWIGLAQDRDRWTALVNSVLHLRVP